VGDKALFVEKYAPTMHAKAAGAESLDVPTTCIGVVAGSNPFTRLGLDEQTSTRLPSNFHQTSRNLPMRIAKLSVAVKILLPVLPHLD
jgi:hypothetical protein